MQIKKMPEGIFLSVFEEGRNIVGVIEVRRDDFLYGLGSSLCLLRCGYIGHRRRMRGARKFKTSSDDGDDDRFAEGFIDGDTVDDVDIIAGSFLDVFDRDGGIL